MIKLSVGLIALLFIAISFSIYAFRKAALLDFYRLPMLSLEASEKLEQLRYLEYGKRIKMVETTHGSIGIDTLEDLEKARKLI